MQKPPEAFVAKLAELVAHLLEELSLQCHTKERKHAFTWSCISWPSLGWAAPLKVRLKKISPEQLRLLRRQCNRMHVAPSIRCVDQVLTGTRTSICLCCTIEMNLKYVQSGWIIMFSSINLSLWFLERDVVFIRSLFRFFLYKKEQSWSVLLQKGARHLCRWYFIP